MKRNNIKLGDEVKDLIKNYKGIVVARTKFLNGCIQYSVASKIKEDKNIFDEEPSIDEHSLKVIKRGVVPSCEYPENEDENESVTGGPIRKSKNIRGY